MSEHYIRLSGLIFLTLAACAKLPSTSSLPMVTPPVRAVTPASFLSARSLRSLSVADFRSRFFSTGPTSVLGILSSIDSRISAINQQIVSSSATCLTQVPVGYTVTPWQQTVTMYAQCHETVSTPNPVSSDPQLVQWGVRNGVTYLYVAVGPERAAVMMTPNPTVSGKYLIKAWIGLGYENSHCAEGGWDTCSYGVMQVVADSNLGTFELAVAGVGFGYCGAQLKSDGTTVYAMGSKDSGSTCQAPDTLCVKASDGSASVCSGELMNFSIPAIGRMAVSGTNLGSAPVANWAASLYPPVSNVALDGTSADDLNFGPLSATAGVGAF